MRKLQMHLLAAALSVVPAGTALADTLSGVLVQSGSFDGATLLVTSNARNSGITCGILGDAYSVIVTGGTTSEPAVTTLVVASGTKLSPGDRFHLAAGEACPDKGIELVLTLVEPDA
ncbi:MAG: hypothetical protein V3S70_03900 [Gammaproteobacteria bacterium]